jgi:hypothetical protein
MTKADTETPMPVNERPRGAWVVLSSAAVIAAAASALGAGAQDTKVFTPISGAMMRWQIGVGRTTPASDVIETISEVTRDGRRAWRVTHYPVDPADGTYDFYDVDAVTFAPIASVMRTRAFDLSLTFDAGRVLVRRTEKDQVVTEDIPLSATIMPEGPGTTAFMAALPLRPGYTLTYRIVDRFDGQRETRVKTVRLSVSGPRPAATAMGRQDVFDVTSAAEDGSFTDVRQLRVRAPHYPYRVEFSRGKTPFVSQVTAMAVAEPARD